MGQLTMGNNNSTPSKKDIPLSETVYIDREVLVPTEVEKIIYVDTPPTYIDREVIIEKETDLSPIYDCLNDFQEQLLNHIQQPKQTDPLISKLNNELVCQGASLVDLRASLNQNELKRRILVRKIRKLDQKYRKLQSYILYGIGINIIFGILFLIL